jgi:hypothetical protein
MALLYGRAAQRALNRSKRRFPAQASVTLTHRALGWLAIKCGGLVGQYGMPLNETTMADHFLAAGYRTHAVGKWRAGPRAVAPPSVAERL